MKSIRAHGLAITVAAFFVAPDAIACISTSLEKTRQFSDVIAEGTFVIDSGERGEGHIVAARTMKGIRKKTYQVRWDPNILPEELPDCGIEIPASGSFEGFSLRKQKGATYRLTGRWQPARKVR